MWQQQPQQEQEEPPVLGSWAVIQVTKPLASASALMAKASFRSRRRNFPA